MNLHLLLHHLIHSQKQLFLKYQLWLKHFHLQQEKVLNELKICSLTPLTKIEIYKLYYPEVVIVNEAVYI